MRGGEPTFTRREFMTCLTCSAAYVFTRFFTSCGIPRKPLPISPLPSFNQTSSAARAFPEEREQSLQPIDAVPRVPIHFPALEAIVELGSDTYDASASGPLGLGYRGVLTLERSRHSKGLHVAIDLTFEQDTLLSVGASIFGVKNAVQHYHTRVSYVVDTLGVMQASTSLIEETHKHRKTSVTHRLEREYGWLYTYVRTEPNDDPQAFVPYTESRINHLELPPYSAPEDVTRLFWPSYLMTYATQTGRHSFLPYFSFDTFSKEPSVPCMIADVMVKDDQISFRDFGISLDGSYRQEPNHTTTFRFGDELSSLDGRGFRFFSTPFEFNGHTLQFRLERR